MSRTRRMGSPLTVLVTVVVATACAQADPARVGAESADGNEGFPITVDAANGKVVIEQQPKRIISFSATSTEMLFAIEAGDQVVAVDDTSNYPPEAPITQLSAYEPNVEAIADFEPDLVVISDDINELAKALEALDIPVIHHPAARGLEDTYAQIQQLGAATGHDQEAVELVASMRSEIEQLVASVPTYEEPPTYYHELDQNFFTVTSDTFIGQIYSLAGLENIADEAKGAASGYPQLSAEYIVDADPEFIFLSDTKCCGQTLETVARRPGWDQITAVKRGAVVELDDDVASRWGPRIVELLETVVREVSTVASPV
jgi:iron complex transport system substrate-binding protein